MKNEKEAPIHLLESRKDGNALYAVIGARYETRIIQSPYYVPNTTGK